MITAVFVGAVIVVGITAAVVRSRYDNFVIGTWSYSGTGDYVDSPMVLHVFRDHTFMLEGKAGRCSRSGNWTLNGFPLNTTFTLHDFYIGTDATADAEFTLNRETNRLDERILTRYRYYKASNDPVIHLDERERLVIGDWMEIKSPQDWTAARFVLLSNHVFTMELDGSGSWQLRGDTLTVNWKEANGPKRNMEMKVDSDHRKLWEVGKGKRTFEPNLYISSAFK